MKFLPYSVLFLTLIFGCITFQSIQAEQADLSVPQAKTDQLNADVIPQIPAPSTKNKNIPPDDVDERRLIMHNLNTGEDINIVFWAGGVYLPESLSTLDHFFRDWRSGTVTKMDPELYTLIYNIYQKFDTDEPINLISGHRSQKTNDALRAKGGGQAKKSQHILGKAADIAIPGISTKKLRNTALKMAKGGVGYYPKSGFVHVDTGRLRQW